MWSEITLKPICYKNRSCRSCISPAAFRQSDSYYAIKTLQGKGTFKLESMENGTELFDNVIILVHLS